MATNAELSIQLQTDSIAAVQAAFINAVVARPQDTLWWLADYSHDITYENRVKGNDLLVIDNNIAAVNLGSTLFGSWFTLHNTYFSSDQPIDGVSALDQAVELAYRWRVSQYFNDVMVSGNSVNITPDYVFPYPDFNIGTYASTGTNTGTYTKGSGPLDLASTGPGILMVTATEVIGTNDMVLVITGVYQDGSTVTLPATLTGASIAGSTALVGGQALTSGYTAPSDAGVVHVGSTAKFKAGNWVLLRQDLTGTTDFYWKTEIAEVKSVDSGTQLTLRQPTPASGTVYSPGLRNSYTTSATVYPLFIDISAVTHTNGNADDALAFTFNPDRPQGFLDISSISYPQ